MRIQTLPAYLRSLTRFAVVLGFFGIAHLSWAQGRGPGGGGPGGGMPRGGVPFGGGMNRGNMAPGSSSGGNGNQSTIRGGLQLGPPGRWWDDKRFAATIGLDYNQQHRMDDVFKANKETLVKLYKNLQHEESELEKTTRHKVLYENEIFQQIDRVAQARGDLEKANAHMLLEIRKEMTPEQTAKLDDQRPTPE